MSISFVAGLLSFKKFLHIDRFDHFSVIATNEQIRFRMHYHILPGKHNILTKRCIYIYKVINDILPINNIRIILKL